MLWGLAFGVGLSPQKYMQVGFGVAASIEGGVYYAPSNPEEFAGEFYSFDAWAAVGLKGGSVSVSGSYEHWEKMVGVTGGWAVGLGASAGFHTGRIWYIGPL